MHELLDDPRDDVVDGEAPLATRELGLEDHLEKQVPELLADALPVAGVDGVDDLARLLQHILAQRLERLLAVPGAAVRGQQPPHEAHQPRERGAVLQVQAGDRAGGVLVEAGELSRRGFGPMFSLRHGCGQAGYIGFCECRPRPSPRRRPARWSRWARW